MFLIERLVTTPPAPTIAPTAASTAASIASTLLTVVQIEYRATVPAAATSVSPVARPP